MPRAPGGGSLADDFAKGIAEVGLIRKPAFQCDLAERIVRYGHQLLRARDSHSFDILTGRATKTCFEDTIELVAVELGDPGQIPRSDLRMKVNGYITLDAARLPQLDEIATLRCSRRFRRQRVDDRAALVRHESPFRYTDSATLR